ncbi:hypothetical protein QR685DRAFT_561670 [Neurospora intermedia]|uniref:NmrA-like domain-containing protein n=1 Tax=Neurospora intermedia TaxID=5142 RepID=A0ABR3DH46_NEUIN
MTRNICITAGEGQSGFLIAELLLKENKFAKRIDSITSLVLDPTNPKCTELESLGAKIVPHHPGRERQMVKTFKEVGCDTICVIPPAHKDKVDITIELCETAKKAKVQNRKKQPRLREFIDIENIVLSSKGDPSVELGHSPCVIRAGFYAENLLLYPQQAQLNGILPLPIGENHKFAPVALGDIAYVAACVLAGKGKHGFDDRHRGQMMIVTGPMLCAGKELAEAASQAVGQKMEFENISEREAKRILKAQADIDDSEKEYLLEYYSLVREGKTNYVVTTAFHDVTGEQPTQPSEFFRMYSHELRPKKKAKTDNST